MMRRTPGATLTAATMPAAMAKSSSVPLADEPIERPLDGLAGHLADWDRSS